MKNKITFSFEFEGAVYDSWYQYCNKPKCSGCPHGPYWRRRIRLEKGKTITRYIGRVLPQAPGQRFVALVAAGLLKGKVIKS